MKRIFSHKMRTTFFFILAGVALSVMKGSAQEQEIRVYGEAPQFSKQEIVFQHYQNFLNREQQPLFTIKIDEEGKFDIRRELDEITYAFADLGRFRGFLYLEPGKEYELKLPPKEELSQSEKLNPFFQREEILLGIRNEKPTGLNPLIRDFDDEFDYQLNTKAVELITRQNHKLALSIIDTLESKFPADHEFFRKHKQYRYAKLKMLASRSPKKSIISEYFAGEPVLYSMPAYWETFREVFKGYGRRLFEEGQLGEGPVSFEKLAETIRNDTLYQRTDLTETLVLWALYESYHNEVIPRKQTIRLLNETSEKASLSRTQSIASVLHERIRALRTGTRAPKFDLISFSGENQTLEDFRGKFVYLNFVHTDDYACRKDMNRIPRILEKFGEDLQVVTIIVNEDFDKAKQYVNNQQQKGWDFLYFGMDANLLKNYNVEAVPIYYLIDPEGKLVASPAPTPGENFHDKFVAEYQKYRKAQQRKNRGEQKSIFGP
ncbi:MAG: TlpA family protein disulfide reductase [Marinilabilia sp.]